MKDEDILSKKEHLLDDKDLDKVSGGNIDEEQEGALCPYCNKRKGFCYITFTEDGDEERGIRRGIFFCLNCKRDFEGIQSENNF